MEDRRHMTRSDDRSTGGTEQLRSYLALTNSWVTTVDYVKVYSVT